MLIPLSDAGGETNIPDMARLYRGLGKQTFAICDKQSPTHKAFIDAEVDVALMHEEKGFEDLVLKNTTEDALIRFARLIDWPPHLLAKYPDPTIGRAYCARRIFRLDKRKLGGRRFPRTVRRNRNTPVAPRSLHDPYGRLYARPGRRSQSGVCSSSG